MPCTSRVQPAGPSTRSESGSLAGQPSRTSSSRLSLSNSISRLSAARSSDHVRSAIASSPVARRSPASRRYRSASTTFSGSRPVIGSMSASRPAPSAVPYISSDACRAGGSPCTRTTSTRTRYPPCPTAGARSRRFTRSELFRSLLTRGVVLTTERPARRAGGDGEVPPVWVAAVVAWSSTTWSWWCETSWSSTSSYVRRTRQLQER